jgi:hypothetical protein
MVGIVWPLLFQPGLATVGERALFGKKRRTISEKTAIISRGLFLRQLKTLVAPRVLHPFLALFIRTEQALTQQTPAKDTEQLV